MKTKSLRVLLALFSFLCPYSLCAYDFEVDNIQYTFVSVDELTLEVSGLTDTNVNELIIPATVEYNGRTLTIVSIASYAFRDCSSLTSITIPDGVTSIGSYAFDGCIVLKEITIPNSVTSIGNYAFGFCSKLESITIPEGITRIEDSTFYGCSSLTSITIPDGVTSIGSYAFSGCSSLTSIKIPDGVTSIGSFAFDGCSSLTSITIPDGVTSIGSHAFYKCSSLTSITIPNSVTSIGSYAFDGCSSLTSIKIPDGVTSIGRYAFDGCSSLESITIGSGIEYSYSGSSLSSSYNGKNWYYPLLCFGAPEKMKKIIISDGLTSFGIRGYGCDASVAISERRVCVPSFSNIDVEYFYVGRPLVEIKNWVYSSKTFYLYGNLAQPYGSIDTLEINGYCSDVPYFYQSINNLILGYGIETYDVSNIYQDNLKTITCKSMTPPTIIGNFNNMTYIDVTLYVPIGSKEIYQATDGWKSFWDIQEIDVPTSIEKVTNNTESPLITISDGSIIVRGANDAIIQVCNLSGQVIYKGHDTIIPIGKHGIYIVKVKGVTKKILM